MDIIEVNKANLAERGFFCYMSKKKSEGYQRKREWLKARFDEGMKIQLLDLEQGGRGFIEYIPGQFAWRAVNAEGYMFIHCIWVVGKSKGKGHATLLLNECMKDAEKAGLKGVAAVTSEGNWLIGRNFLLKHDFKSVAQYPPFDLAVKRFDDAPLPSFSGDFKEKLSTCENGLTVFRSDQCPYIEAAAKAALDTAEELNISAKVIELKNAEEVRGLSPSPYGVFSIVYDGKLVSYHSIARKELVRDLRASESKK